MQTFVAFNDTKLMMSNPKQIGSDRKCVEIEKNFFVHQFT
jgi:hypothetical protein